MAEIDKGLQSELPESIPNTALGNYPRFNEGAAHPVGLLDYWEYREYWNLPETFRNRVCHGYRREESKSHEGYRIRDGVPCCGTCGKPPVYLLFYCLNCGDLFIKDFSDSRFCGQYPHCFNCLSELSWSHCPDHTPKFFSDLYMMRDNPTEHGPAGFNPRKWTDEELADAFDFD